MILSLLVLLLTACSADDPVPATPETGRTITLQLAVPVDDDPTLTRAPGDPGLDASLPAPTYAYIYFVKDNGDLGQLYDKDLNEITNPIIAGTGSLLGEPKEETYHGTLASKNDQIYTYELIDLKLEPGVMTGKFFVVMADVPLTIDMTNGVENATIDITQTAGTGTLQDHLQHIYSTPYNYNVDGQYYGNVKDANDVVELMLYHVAARVDLKWNVTTAMQPTRKISTMTVKGQMRKKGMLFKPMENTDESSGMTASGSAYFTLKESADVSKQWYGRTAFYALPFKNTSTKMFTIPLEINSTTRQMQLNMTSAHTVFVPWIRVNMLFDSDTKFEGEVINPTLKNL